MNSNTEAALSALLLSVEEAVANGNAPWVIEEAFEAYEAARSAEAKEQS